MMNDLIQPLIIFLFALIGGIVVGYALRKIIKILLILGGAFIFALVVLQGFGWIQPDYDKMVSDAETFASNTNLTQAQQFADQFNPIVFVGLALGMIVGFVGVGRTASSTKKVIVK